MATSLKMSLQAPDDEWLTAEPAAEADSYPDDTDEQPATD